MNENDFYNADAHTRGSAWAALDETFFALLDGLFSRGFCALADGMLAANDNRIEAKIDADPRQAAMRRHPSSRRRF